MKKALSIAALTLAFATVLAVAVIPASAVTNPYGTEEVGCITNISMKNYSDLGGVNYFESSVTSYIQGVSTRGENTYDTYGAIGGPQSKVFVYSVGTDDDMDFKNDYIKNIVEAFEEKNPEWKALAAINGDFFDIETKNSPQTGEPEGPMIQNGDVFKISVPAQTGRGVLGFNSDGTAIWDVEGSSYYEANYTTTISRSLSYTHTLSVLGEHKTNAVLELEARAYSAGMSNRACFVTPDTDKANYTGYSVAVVKYDRYRHSRVGTSGMPSGSLGFFIEGEVVEIREGKKNELPEEGYCFIALPDNVNYTNNIKKGTYIKLERTLTDEWKDVESAIGFKQVLLMNGTLLLKNAYGTYNTDADKAETAKWTGDLGDYPHCWKCRTAVGIRPDGTTVFLVTDKGSAGALGASFYELAEQLKALGCNNAFLLDGGGSSSFLTRNSDGSFSTTFTGENGANGRRIANVMIMAVRNEDVPLPEQDPMIETVAVPKPTKPAKTDKAEETDETIGTDATDNTDNTDTLTPVAPEPEQPGENGNLGCRISLTAMPAVALTVMGGICLLGIRKKKKK